MTGRRFARPRRGNPATVNGTLTVEKANLRNESGVMDDEGAASSDAADSVDIFDGGKAAERSKRVVVGSAITLGGEGTT